MWQYTPRVAVIRGVRTPFAKSGTHYARLSALDLGKLAVSELVARAGIDPRSVQEVVFGNVIPSVKAPNIAREIVLGTGLPRKIPGYTVGKACASANQAFGRDLYNALRPLIRQQNKNYVDRRYKNRLSWWEVKFNFI